MDLKTLYNLIKESPMTYEELKFYLKSSNDELDNMLSSLISDKLIRTTNKGVYKVVSSKREPRFIEKNLSEDFIKELILVGKNSFDQLKKATAASKDELEAILLGMKERGILSVNKDKFFLIKKGIVGVTESGNRYCRCDDGTSYDLPAFESADLYDSDTITIKPYIGMDKMAHVLDVIDRGHKFIVGELIRKTKNNKIRYVIKSKTPKFELTLNIDETKLNGAVEGMIVKASLNYMAGLVLVDKIEEVLGNKDDPGMEILKIATEFGFESSFPDEVKDEVKKIPSTVIEPDLGYRKDFRNRIIFTIDGDTSKDFDDAVSLEINEFGNYMLGVYIADVSHYVKFKAPLDIEALKRGTSVYLADRVIPMLPHELSNGICSLNEGVDRLVLACEMEISPKGKLLNYEISEGVIKSAHRMTYNKINKMLEGDSDTIKDYEDIYDTVLKMAELSKIVRELRTKKGALEFDTVEYSFMLNEDGSPKSIERRERFDAEKLIEDFMLLANETVAYHMNVMNLPIVYRIHEKPDQDKLHKTIDEIRAFDVPVKNTKNDIHPKELQMILSSLKDNPNKDIISNMLLRSMMKAKYSNECLGHYGLAMNYYCHFTSPIRRYPDLMTHRMIKKLFLHPSERLDDDIKYFSALMPEIALKTSASERRSVDCEREVDNMLYSWYMESNINKVFDGKIRSVTSFGMFIELDKGVEGLFLYKNANAYFTFSEKTYTAEANGKLYKVGDKVKVRCTLANREDRRIDFMLEGY